MCTTIWDTTGIFPVCLLCLLKGSGLLYQLQCNFCRPHVGIFKSLQHLKRLQAESHHLCSVVAVNHNSCYNSDKMSRDCHWEWRESTQALSQGRRYGDVSHFLASCQSLMFPAAGEPSLISVLWAVHNINESVNFSATKISQIQARVCQCIWYCLERERLIKAEASRTLWSWMWKERRKSTFLWNLWIPKVANPSADLKGIFLLFLLFC